jgi:hypothetical protein
MLKDRKYRELDKLRKELTVNLIEIEDHLKELKIDDKEEYNKLTE